MKRVCSSCSFYFVFAARSAPTNQRKARAGSLIPLDGVSQSDSSTSSANCGKFQMLCRSVLHKYAAFSDCEKGAIWQISAMNRYTTYIFFILVSVATTLYACLFVRAEVTNKYTQGSQHLQEPNNTALYE